MKAILLGLGGVLIDSEKHWQEDQMDFFRSLGDWTQKDQAKTIGADMRRLHKMLLEKGFDITFTRLKEVYDELDERVYAKECELYAGVPEKLKELSGKFTLALATSTRRKNLDIVLDRFGIRGLFSITVSADDVSASKPHPGVYLHAARLLDVAPRECVVIDDSDHGIVSAQEAGMASIGIVGAPGQSLDKAQIVVDGVRDITIRMIEEPWDSVPR